MAHPPPQPPMPRGPFQQAPGPVVAPPAPISYGDVGPSRRWYWAASLPTPAYFLLLAVIDSLGVPDTVFMIASVLSSLVGLLSLGTLITVFFTRAHRKSLRQRLHAHHLWYEAVRNGRHPDTARPAPPPRLRSKDLRPRRLWYVGATVLLMLAIPVSSPIFDQNEGLGFIVLTLIGAIGAMMIAGATIERAGHQGRIIEEHLARELEWAREGHPSVPGHRPSP
ncbi:hypothetical protein [Nocardiopsis alba]|uniref:hypothetical protein n=1 Tax=Nocardiopsis alba TaxID=53437 RepID=UPI00339E619F